MYVSKNVKMLFLHTLTHFSLSLSKNIQAHSQDNNNHDGIMTEWQNMCYGVHSIPN